MYTIPFKLDKRGASLAVSVMAGGKDDEPAGPAIGLAFLTPPRPPFIIGHDAKARS